jgi:hypothetical protein
MYAHARTLECAKLVNVSTRRFEMMKMTNYHIGPDRSSVAEPLQHTSEWDNHETGH